MKNQLDKSLDRRNLLRGLALAGGGALSGIGAAEANAESDGKKATAEHGARRLSGNMGTVGDVGTDINGFDVTKMLTDWDGGVVSSDEDGRTVRTYTIEAIDKDIEIAPGVIFPAWTFNGRVPGPTIRATEGDRLRIVFRNLGSHPHSMHFHGIHSARMDGIPGTPGMIDPGEEFIYEFDAVNTVSNHFFNHPIRVEKSRPIRIYLVNMTEFDPINSFHLHANFFDYYDHGTTLTPTLRNVDTIMQCQAQRGILEMSFADHEPGQYMFHAHQAEFAELGWMSMLDVVEDET